MEFSGDMRKPPPPNSFQERARRFGIFLRQRLDHLRLTREAFAQRLDMEPELLDAILNGDLPLSQIPDELVVDMAEQLELEPDLLRIIVQRPEQTLIDTIQSSEPGEDVHATLEAFVIQPDPITTARPQSGLSTVGNTLAEFQAEEVETTRPQPPSTLKDPTKTLENFRAELDNDLDADALASTS